MQCILLSVCKFPSMVRRIALLELKHLTGVTMLHTNSFKATVSILAITLFSFNQASQAATYTPDVMSDFPYAGKPFQASVTFAAARIESEDKLERAMAQVLTDRTKLEGFDRRHGFHFMYGVQKRQTRDLVLIVPGFGGTGSGAGTESIAVDYYKAGYNVATVPSPFSGFFARHISKSAIPGNFDADAADLFVAINAVIARLKTEGAKFEGIRLVGYSYGALTVAHLKRLNAAGSYLPNVKKYVAINPPINMQYALDKLQEYTNLGAAIGPDKASSLYNWVWGRMYTKLVEQEFTESYYHDLNGVEKLSDKSIQWLIQGTFRESMKWVIFTANQINELGLIPRATNGRRDPAYVAAARWGFTDYLERLSPLAFPGDTRNPRDQMISQGFLQAIQGLDTSDLLVLHNRNDFLITSDDLSELEAALNRQGGDLVLFSDGGHMGNFWWPAWTAELIKHTSR